MAHKWTNLDLESGGNRKMLNMLLIGQLALDIRNLFGKKKKNGPFVISGSYFCFTQMCFWSCPGMQYDSKSNISHCQCSFWTVLVLLGLGFSKLITTTAEKIEQYLAKSKLLANSSHHIGINVLWEGLERGTEPCI